MKTATIFKYFALFLAITIMSCGGSDDDSGNGTGGGTDNTVTAINVSTINVDGTIGAGASGTVDVFVDQVLNFTVLDNLGNNVTSDVVVTINGNTETLPYTFTTAGTYDVVITYTNAAGDTFTTTYTVIVNPIPVPNSIILSADVTSTFIGEDATFTVMDDLGNNISSLATITVAGNAITANPYTFTAEGSFDVIATFTTTVPTTLTSNTVTITVVRPHVTKVMVEDFTGAWCGFCPRLAHKIDALAASNSKVIPLAIHNGDNMVFSGGPTLENNANISGWPTGKINKNMTWNETDAQVLAQLTPVKPLGLAIDSNIAGSTLTVTAKVAFDLTVSGTHKLVVFVLEDGLIANQTNYMNNDSSSPWYQAGNPIVGFVHDNVVRANLTNSVLGDVIPTAETIGGNEYSKDFTYTIPSGYNAANLELVAFVVDASGKAVNAQYVKAGQNQAFELVP